MTMHIKRKCQWHEGLALTMHPEWAEKPWLCVWCHGTMETDVLPNLQRFTGRYRRLRQSDIQESQEDIYVSLKCSCGGTATFTEAGQVRACDCGKIYRLGGLLVTVNEEHVGDLGFFPEESARADELDEKELHEQYPFTRSA